MLDVFRIPIHYTLTRTTDATVEPITAAEARAFLYLDSTDQDALVTTLIKVARQKVEADTGRALITQTWTMGMDSAPSGGAAILLPIAPAATVTGITQYSTADVGTTVATSVYRLDTASVPARIVLKDGQSWPTGLRPENALSIVFTAGYGAQGVNVTDTALLLAMRMLIADWYENRGSVVVGETAQRIVEHYEMLIAPYKVTWL